MQGEGMLTFKLSTCLDGAKKCLTHSFTLLGKISPQSCINLNDHDIYPDVSPNQLAHFVQKHYSKKRTPFMGIQQY